MTAAQEMIDTCIKKMKELNEKYLQFTFLQRIYRTALAVANTVWVGQGMKAKMREKVRPKLGKIDIDYQKLHDAFFKWQTKPRMTMHGDLYYEGKEFEIRRVLNPNYKCSLKYIFFTC